MKIKNPIKIFEENTVSREDKNENKNDKNYKNCQKSSKVKTMDAFEKIMSTNGVGDTLKKTPKRKPKRISSTNSTGKNRNVLEKWLNRANKM